MQKVVPIQNTFLEVNGFNYGDSSEISQFQILQILSNKEYYLNIGRNIIFTADKSDYMYYEKHVVKANENGDTLSYNLYGTVHYWGILAFFNDIQNPFENLYIGQELIVLKRNYIPILLGIFNREKEK